MELTKYYQQIREVEATLADYPLVVSVETGDGGRGGTVTETSRRLAAKMIVEGKARLASEAQIKKHRDDLARAIDTRRRELAAAQVQFAVLTTNELARLKGDEPAADRPQTAKE